MPNIPEACEPFEADLSALIDGELSPSREEVVRTHVVACPHCSERLQALCDVDLELAAAPVPEVAADLRARLADRIARDAVAAAAAPASARAAPPRRRRWLSTPARVAVAAAAAAAALYLAGVGRDARLPTVPPGPGPRVAVSDPIPPPPEAGPAELLPPPAPPPLAPAEAAAPSRIASAPAEPSDADVLGAASDEDLAVVLDLETVEDLDLLANLDLLERWLVIEEGAAG